MIRRRLTFLLFLLVSVATPTFAQQTSAASIEISAFYDGTARTGYWVPVRVTVTNDGADRNATIRIITNTSGTFDTPVELPRGARKSLVVYVRPRGFTRSFDARLLDGSQELARDNLTVTMLPQSALMLGMAMEQPLTMPLPVPASKVKLTALNLTSDDLTARPEGIAMFDGLVFDAPTFQALQPEQVTALDDWVQSGGQLLLSAGQDPAFVASLPTAFQIGTVGGLGEQAVGTGVLHELGADARIQAALITPTGKSTGVDPLVAQRQWGRGRITLVGWNMSDLALQQLPRDTGLWDDLVQFRRTDPNLQGDMTPDAIQEQQFVQALFNLPALSLPPMNVLAALLGTYILLVGPGLYFLLRRLDRQALAWVLIPAITVVFTLGTYGYGLSIRGNDVLLNELSFIQPLGDRARIRTFAGIFSPSDRAYNITVADDALTRPLQMDGMNWGGQAGAGGGQFMQGAVHDLTVDQWSMTTFAAETRQPFRSLSAELEMGERVLRGTVRNDGSTTVRDVAVIFGTRAHLVGELAPGASKTIEFPVDNMGSNNTSVSATIFRGRWSPTSGPPPELRTPAQLLDSLYSYVTVRSTTPLVIGWLDQSPLQLITDEQRVQAQQLALVEVPVDLSYAEKVAFPRGFFPITYDTGEANNQCMSQWGVGTVIESNTITATLRLPQAARDLGFTKATIYPQIEGQANTRIVSDVFDWEANDWTPQSERLAPFELSDPARFVRDGEMRVRMRLGNGDARSGCAQIDASIEGTR